jgi:hypothetical protein
MNQTTIRYTAAGIAIAAAAAISLATEPNPPIQQRADPSVPAAWQVIHPNDGRTEGNVQDLTY